MKRLLCALVVAVTVASVAGIMAQTPDPGRGGVWVTGTSGGSGDITSVVAGAGMTGGGTEGDVTLNVIGTADAITVSADAVTIASTYVGQTSITTLGTVATGTWQATDVGVAYGGTGVSTLTDGGVLLGSGTGAVTALAALADGAIVIGDGTGDPTTLDVGSSTAITVLGTVATGTWEATDVGVAHGGTGVSSLTANSLLLGAGTSAVTFAAPGASGNVLTSNGTVWASAAPAAITSLDTGTVAYAGRTITVDTGGSLDVVLASSAGDDFTVDTSKLVVEGDSGNVGIGTVVPGSKLEVAGDAANTNENSAQLQLIGSTDENKQLRIGYNTTDNNGFIQAVRVGTGQDALLLNPEGGNVGIGGLAAPDGTLHVQTATAGSVTAGAGADDLVVENSTHVGMTFLSPSGDYQQTIAFGDVGDADSGRIVYNHDSNQLALWTEGSSRVTVSSGGNVAVTGSLSKGSGSFKIDHPLPALSETHSLVHSFIEGPRADLIYRGIVTLVDGSATVDLDDAAGMTAGTWVLLCRDPQVFSSNATGWSPVRGTVSGSTLTIESEEGTSTDTVSWMVVAERQDQHMINTDWTDEDGRPIIEPLKPTGPSGVPDPAPSPPPA